MAYTTSQITTRHAKSQRPASKSCRFCISSDMTSANTHPEGDQFHLARCGACSGAAHTYHANDCVEPDSFQAVMSNKPRSEAVIPWRAVQFGVPNRGFPCPEGWIRVRFWVRIVNAQPHKLLRPGRTSSSAAPPTWNCW